MKLADVLYHVETTSPVADVDILDIAYDSRKVKPGSLFVCIPGNQQDGHNFAGAAVENGAAALICERVLPFEIPQVIVENAREALAIASANFFGRPADKMTMIGITGTNGKTTTAFMIKTVLEANGIKTGLVGTVACMAGEENLGATLTTPESRELHEMFAHMLQKGCQAVVMEVSSHALSQNRVTGIAYAVGVFTNLTQDHLDYHGTMENYASEKRKLFAQCKAAAFNADEAHAAYMAEGFSGTALFYGTSSAADMRAKDIAYHADSIAYTLNLEQKDYNVKIAIPGQFTVYNSLACASACKLLNLPMENILSGMRQIHTVPGRIEVVPTPGQAFTVILDYAHTPDGLENILKAVRGFARGRVITVFGCGGDRDRKKRPLMGYAAGKLSDYCVVTSDNPRTEAPMKIIEDILPGMLDSGCEFEVEENRVEAIARALICAQAGDVVVLAGKGHEPYQEIQGVRHPFDEKAIVQEIISKMR